MSSIISIKNLSKTYASGFQALKTINLDIKRGEIFALLGPNGAGKTTLIGIVCGIVNASTGSVTVDGHDIVKDYRAARSMIGLVPQELTTDAFETVWNTVSFSRGLFGKPRNPAHIEKILKDLSLWDKKDSKIMALSGGMKRRVMIAKALSHEPQVLFLDEPTAGVDVELRKDMWQVVRDLRAAGVTIILTTHYIEEAEDMADRIGVISKGEIILVENKVELMRKLGKKQLILQLQKPLDAVPAELSAHNLTLGEDGKELVFTYDTQGERTGVTALLSDLNRLEIRFRDLRTTQSPRLRIFSSAWSAKAQRRCGSSAMNSHAIWAIYKFEVSRTARTIWQSIVSPVISTSLYFVVFGAAIGSRITQIEGIAYGAFIVPGLIMLMLLTQSTMNASFGIYFPRFTGTIYEILSAPVSSFEIACGYVGAAATKSIVLGLIILATSWLFVPMHIAHPLWMLAFLVLTGDHLQPVRLHHRHLGRRLRTVADHSAADHHAADVPRRHLLFDPRAAAVLAEGHAVQPGGLSDQRLPLELLRDLGRQPAGQPCHDAGVLRDLSRDNLVDFQDRLSTEEVANGPIDPRALFHLGTPIAAVAIIGILYGNLC